jgi:hypothetical protein
MVVWRYVLTPFVLRFQILLIIDQDRINEIPFKCGAIKSISVGVPRMAETLGLELRNVHIHTLIKTQPHHVTPAKPRTSRTNPSRSIS